MGIYVQFAGFKNISSRVILHAFCERRGRAILDDREQTNGKTPLFLDCIRK